MELLLALKKFATEILQYWKQLLAIIIIALLMYGSHVHATLSTEQKYEKIIKEMNEADIKKHDEFTKEKQHIAEQFENWRNTHPVIKEVLVYVDPNLDSLCSISNGFVRVHDAAAIGKQIGSPSESDGSTSNIGLSRVARVVSGNYEKCNLEFEKLKSLQMIVKKYQEIQK